MSLLEVDGFTLSFVQYARGLRRRRLDVVTGLDLHVDAGELVAVVGASGSGKSLLAHALLGLLPSNAREGGRLVYDGAPLTRERRQALRGRELALVPQSVTALDPLMPIERQVRRAARLAGRPDPGLAARDELMARRLPENSWSAYPHQLSGGMARRVLAAVATMGESRLVVADEPTPGLQAEIVTETLTALRGLADRGAAVVLITHELSAALEVADRIAVFNAGTTVEQAPATAFEGDGRALAHPYSRALWQALPRNGMRTPADADAPVVTSPAAPAPPAGPVLRADGVAFRYDDRAPWVLHDVDIEVEPGRVTGLRGPSGVGKSTLARLLAGYLTPSRGSVTLDGRPLPAGGRSPVQLVLQHPEHALDPRWRLGRSLAEGGPVDPRLLEELSIETSWLERYPNELSGGELQRLALARALAAEPTVLVADEITTMLDALTQAQLWRALLRRVREHGLTVVAISHDDELLGLVADRVVDLAPAAVDA